jgi:hypothetical protein
VQGQEKGVIRTLQKHHNEFMWDESLKELHHPHVTDHMEAFKKVIMKFFLKDRTCCKTIWDIERLKELNVDNEDGMSAAGNKNK